MIVIILLLAIYKLSKALFSLIHDVLLFFVEVCLQTILKEKECEKIDDKYVNIM